MTPSSSESRPRRLPATLRRSLLALLLGVLVSVAATGAAAAQEAQPAQPAAPASAKAPRIAVINLEAVFLDSPEGVNLKADIEELQKSVQTELEGYGAKLDELDASLATASPDQARLIARQQEDTERAARRAQDGASRKASTLEQQSREAFNQRVTPIFKAIQTERNFDLILNKTPGVVIFAGPALDITSEVLQRLTTP